jgi:MFS family permease
VRPTAFSALKLPGFAPYLATFVLTMMADNVEHVISYWVIYQKFHSAALGGFAVISHWLPFLLGSVAVGALNDRYDSRRLIQLGGVLFVIASAGWGYFFVTDTLEQWHAMILLVIHGCAGTLWSTSSQMLLYDIVGPEALPSAVRLSATGRYLGTLVGPGVGTLIMYALGPTYGIFLNTAFYLPLLIWLLRAPYGRHFRGDQPAAKRAVRGFADIVETIRDIKSIRILAPMIALAGCVSFFVGNSYQAQMPGFATDLGHGDAGAAYMALLAADAAGALTAGVLLEARGGIFEISSRNALVIALVWAFALLAFAVVGIYPLALALLVVAGFCELSFSSMVQTIVQMNAPDHIRGRVLGLYAMAANGLRMFSGITVGLVGSQISIHASLAVAAGAVAIAIGVIYARTRRPVRA